MKGFKKPNRKPGHQKDGKSKDVLDDTIEHSGFLKLNAVAKPKKPTGKTKMKVTIKSKHSDNVRDVVNTVLRKTK